MNLFVLPICVTISFAPSALAQTLQIRGVTGFISEYELSAELSEQKPDTGAPEFSGPMIVKHVGLCTHTGPNEVIGRLKLRFTASSRKIEAKLSYDDLECSYSGFLTESETGFMKCTDRLTLPIRLWMK